jgi:hypothetical protein
MDDIFSDTEPNEVDIICSVYTPIWYVLVQSWATMLRVARMVCVLQIIFFIFKIQMIDLMTQNDFHMKI